MTASSIIFDCDGVLVNSEVIHISVERKYLTQIGLEYSDAEYQSRFVGLTNPDFYRELERDYAALNKGTLPSDIEASIRSESWARFETELVAIDGIHDLLDQLKGPTAVASSSSLRSLHQKLKMTGLFERLDPHIYSGEQVAKGKPAPDLFLFAAQNLGVSPTDCIVVEDSVNGVRSGLAAGMEVWGFTGGGHGDDGLHDRLQQAGAHKVLPTFTEVSQLLS
ncbi:MAG: HAD family hydrolase [Alphaproteobacteria bacterium]|nr:MAG: HAD family hydrolase [Alphaproteobacteria bacterium]